ncbi:MAG: CoA-binding protein [Proteobacteria bacterium]|nr:CoA-binding protein [Pseudomonadota bacterium]MBU4471054.1 CoA-binding protein [Pseudomonadota bacterium]MCG2753654.1 CoA-binding protein [Desulfobacteraceae bacterium]
MNDSQSRFQPLFDPKSIAFIGASNAPGKWGCIVLKNLIAGGYSGSIYPINPKEKIIQGINAFSHIKDIPEIPDLAVIVIPPPAVPRAIEDCVQKGIRAGLIITAGFAEVGGEGEKFQQDMVEKARKGNMILVGPNCNGVVKPSNKLFPQMPSVFPNPGAIAVVSQSGNVATSLTRRAVKSGFGISSMISSGNEADLHCEDYFSYLGDDPETKVIISYIEGFRDGRRFFDTIKKVTLKKPVVMIKAGSTDAGAQAAKSHTASLAGSSGSFIGASKQAGITRADNLEDLFNTGTGFLNQPIPRGNRTAILTMGGGWGVLAADASSRYGLDVVRLSDKTLAALDKILPAWWNPGNPVDMVAGNIEGAMIKSIQVLLEAPETDCLILLGIMGLFKMRPVFDHMPEEEIENHLKETTHQLAEAFDEIRKMSHYHKKPVISATELPFAVGDMEERIFTLLGTKGFALYKTPDTAAKVLSHLVEYGKYLKAVSGER